MKAVILAAGKGKRMKELTQEVPKPMLRVQGRPILEHILEGLLASGIRQVSIITGWQAESIEDYFGDGTRWGAEIRFARQAVPDGTGKAADPARSHVGDEAFLLTYGDILVRPETYRQMLDRFAQGGFSGVITVTAGEDVTKGAINCFDADFCLQRIVEKPTTAQVEALRNEGWLKPGDPAWYNAGIYIFKPVVFDYTARLMKSPRGEYELTDAVAAMVAGGHRIAGLEIAGRWVDVRDPAVLAALQSDTDDAVPPQ
jgi:dTDP-glucose pyrophosphorylase